MAQADTKAVLTKEQEAQLDAVLPTYLQWEINAEYKAKVESMIKAGQRKALYAQFFPRIAFGTAGLRAKMAPGYACINDLVVLQTSQGLLKYAESKFGAAAKQMGIVIGYDGRHNSKRYAEITAAVFLSQGWTVHLFSILACTPMVPFSVLELKTAVGVMVTASHNPKQDNGYKVYWSNGAQIIPPHDKGIADMIEANLQPWQQYVFNPQAPTLKDPTQAMSDKYYSEIRKLYCWTPEDNKDAKLKVAYTAMHGVGTHWTRKSFESFGLPAFVPVKEQVDPDPEFSTVEFPNPEEGKGALALAMKTADANQCSVILANDPDADRLAVAEKDAKTGEWHILNGNQIGVLFADWVWTNYRAKNPQADPSKCYMLASTVSSKMIKAMAQKEGFKFAGTLTGFKWMGNVAADLIAKGFNFLFAYEVEIGFLVGNLSLDKDGVRTAAIFYELANSLYKRGTTLWQHLDALYKKYGYFQMVNSYYYCYDPKKMVPIFERLRTSNNGKYVDKCGPHRILSVRDCTNGYDSKKPGNVSDLPKVPDAQMLTFRFENGTVCTLRGSGTEPKLKFYVECNAPTEDAARKLLDEMTSLVVQEFLQPDVNGLVARKAQ